LRTVERIQNNLVVFFTDQQRWDTTGVHGNPLDLTPNFDRMAVEGTHLYNTFTCQPVCAPARGSLQTGMYATRHGVWRNGLTLNPELPTLAAHFRNAGYHTGYIGKWHLIEDEAGPVPEYLRGGYEYWLASNALEFTSTAYHTVLYDNKDQPVQLPGYRVDALTDAAIRYIADHQQMPFYLFISYIEPHHQNQIDDYVAPDGYRERYAGAWMPPDLAALGGSAHQHLPGYYGQVKRLDEALGRLLEALKSLDLLENTIVLFTSDHGSHFKTRNDEYKRSGHEASIRVPTALRGPGFDGGGRIQKLVSLVDLPPTLLDAAGLSIPVEMQGNSILPLIRHEPIKWQEEVFIQISESQVGRAVRTQRWKYGVVAREKHGWMDMDADTYAEDYLYDLRSDPYELTNLIGLYSHQGVAQVMRQRLLKRMQQAGESIPTIIEAEMYGFGQRMIPEKEFYL
jgi:arylsulfatase A-like enzyme